MSNIDNPYRSPRHAASPAGNRLANDKTPRQIVMAGVFVGTMVGSLCGAIAAMLVYFGLFVIHSAAAGMVGQFERAISELMALSLLGALAGGSSGVAIGLAIGLFMAWRVHLFAGFLRPASIIVWGGIGTAWGATWAIALNSDWSAFDLLIAALVIAISTIAGLAAGMKFSSMLNAYLSNELPRADQR